MPPSRTPPSASPTPAPTPRTPSIPAEVLLRILEHSDSTIHYSTRAAYFKELSLIAKAWTAPARRLLWREVRISSGQAAKECLANSAFGVYPARVLEINGPDVTSEDVVKLFEGCKGITELDLYQVQLRTSTLALPSLAGLRSLTLSVGFFHWQGRIPDSLPFQLETLSISDLTNPTSFLPLLLASCASLDTLAISTLTDPDLIHALLNYRGPQLRYLSLPTFGHSRAADVLATLGHCGKLQRLEINADRDFVRYVLEALPDTPPLQTLKIHIASPKEARDRALGPMKKCLGLPALEELQWLVVVGVDRESVRDFEITKVVAQMCKAQGIELRFRKG